MSSSTGRQRELGRMPILGADSFQVIGLRFFLSPRPFRPEDFTTEDPFVCEILETGINII